MRKLPFIQTSVFVDDRYSFTGNQLATFYEAAANNSVETEEMQGIALEMNFSETTFVFPSDQDCDVKVRIFTPGSELQFAGHPTLGTSFVLKEVAIIPQDISKATLELGIGPIEVEFFNDNRIGMYQPKPTFLDKYEDKKTISKILGINNEDISETYPMQVVSTGFPFLIVPLKSMKVLTDISLNPQLQLELLDSFLTSKILVFTEETIHDDSQVHARMFAPSVGVLEDPATGSAAGPLTAYLDKYNIVSNDSNEISIEQGFEIKRPSRLFGKVLRKGDEITNILVSGKVRKTAAGNFYLK